MCFVDSSVRHRNLLVIKCLSFYRQLEGDFELEVEEFFGPIKSFLALLLEGLDLVVAVQKVRLACRHDKALPVWVLPVETTRALTDHDVEWHHDHLLADQTRREVGVAIHCGVD